ncbi:unnamed protein product [Microthlaspi erraticum]|uniref:Uncharacterized protein n=1 Tax=Microthlaspi erraticum TaxID=1685480 RepID=A0A6D2IMQ9_9BRAS|nr:unnamed protein product [Microthlaspi erraticum]
MKAARPRARSSRNRVTELDRVGGRVGKNRGKPMQNDKGANFKLLRRRLGLKTGSIELVLAGRAGGWVELASKAASFFIPSMCGQAESMHNVLLAPHVSVAP